MKSPYWGEWSCDFCGECWAGAEPKMLDGRDWCGDCKPEQAAKEREAA